jgi:hypothetical protein
MGWQERLEQLGKALGAEPATVLEPASFDDPLALRIEWTPASKQGANFRTHLLAESSPGRLEFKTTLTTKAFCLAFIVAGIGIFAAGMDWSSDASVADWLMPLLMGLAFAGLGAALLWFQGTPRVFDRPSGWFWVGWRLAPGAPLADATRCRLADIHALQVLRTRHTGKNAYWSYELNVVTREARRIHVVSHGAPKSLKTDAQTLAAKLGVKLWDATPP